MEEKGLNKRRTKKILLQLWLIILVLNLIFVLLAMLAPLVQNQWPQISSAIFLIFSPFCHQRTDRSWAIGSYPMALCARCFGIFLGFWLGTIVLPFFQKGKLNKWPKLGWLIAASVPMAVDLIGNISHLWSSSNWLRFLIGLSCGFLWPFYFFPVLFNSINERLSQ